MADQFTATERPRLARKILSYGTAGRVIRSAQGRGVSRSRESYERGQELARQNLARLPRPTPKKGQPR